jgi:hypothetical protein
MQQDVSLRTLLRQQADSACFISARNLPGSFSEHHGGNSIEPWLVASPSSILLVRALPPISRRCPLQNNLLYPIQISFMKYYATFESIYPTIKDLQNTFMSVNSIYPGSSSLFFSKPPSTVGRSGAPPKCDHEHVYRLQSSKHTNFKSSSSPSFCPASLSEPKKTPRAHPQAHSLLQHSHHRAGRASRLLLTPQATPQRS